SCTALMAPNCLRSPSTSTIGSPLLTATARILRTRSDERRSTDAAGVPLGTVVRTMLALHHVLGGRYRVGPLIGRGGTADVPRGDDRVTGDAVALKLLRAVPSLDRWSAREVAALSRLDHPAVVRLRASDLLNDPPYLVLDLVEGEPLSEIVRRAVPPE